MPLVNRVVWKVLEGFAAVSHALAGMAGGLAQC